MLALLVVTAALAHPGTDLGAGASSSAQAAAVALLRFTANQQVGARAQIETIEIEASVPKLNKKGTLHAIRRTAPGHAPEYQVLTTGGDSMVKQHVIVRYLRADEQAAQLSSVSTAITPANYRFLYLGPVQLQGEVAYAYRIAPRRKRQGLMRGVVWLNAERGEAVRESGYLVKSPSVLVRRINLTRQNCFRDGRLETCVTHISVETRVIGTVRLLVTERPSATTAESTK